MKRSGMHPQTKLSTLGRNPDKYDGAVNVPVVRASTILHNTVDGLKGSSIKKTGHVSYGRNGTATTFALTETIADLEGADLSCVFSSGKTAIMASLLAFLKAGDHLLMVDSAYGPSRQLALGLLKRFGVSTTFYEPTARPEDIKKHIRPETKVIYAESPGSLTFEVQDIPSISTLAHDSGAVVILDNTWASPLFCNPFKLGVDVSIHAGTKYIVGHSDVMLGVVSANKHNSDYIQKVFEEVGACPSADDCYLALRGLRTLSVRLETHQKNGFILAEWFSKRSEVKQVLHPGLTDFPGHDIWKRDFTGASGLFGVVLNNCSEVSVTNMLESLQLFGMGYSWGGFESLAIPTWPEKLRSIRKFDYGDIYLRIHAGLENSKDLIEDLNSGFSLLKPN